VKTLVTEPIWKTVSCPASPNPPAAVSSSRTTAQASEGTTPPLTSGAR
jgi:hypothetical protein